MRESKGLERERREQGQDCGHERQLVTVRVEGQHGTDNSLAGGVLGVPIRPAARLA